tara:strand:+ start:49951 stop:50442 length:492 start_codon:yes stop_codon:yes gene_type:complete
MRDNSFKYGFEKEKEFIDFLQKKGYKVRKALEGDDMYNHIDGYILIGNSEFSFDFKTIKKKNRHGCKLDDDKVWVEIQNVKGNPGWLKGKAKYIVFEKEIEYLFVSRESLLRFVEKKVDFNEKCDIKLPYKLYQRKGREDLITIISLKDFYDYSKDYFSIKKQ